MVLETIDKGINVKNIILETPGKESPVFDPARFVSINDWYGSVLDANDIAASGSVYFPAIFAIAAHATILDPEMLNVLNLNETYIKNSWNRVNSSFTDENGNASSVDGLAYLRQLFNIKMAFPDEFKSELVIPQVVRDTILFTNLPLNQPELECAYSGLLKAVLPDLHARVNQGLVNNELRRLPDILAICEKGELPWELFVMSQAKLLNPSKFNEMFRKPETTKRIIEVFKDTEAAGFVPSVASYLRFAQSIKIYLADDIEMGDEIKLVFNKNPKDIFDEIPPVPVDRSF